MADTFTDNIGFRNQTEGGNNNQWGIFTDDNWELADDVLGDTTAITTTGGTTTLTDEQELAMAVKVSGTLVSNAVIEFSGIGKTWVIQNATTGAFTVTAKVTGQTGLAIAQGVTTLVWCDGTDIRQGVPNSELAADTSPRLSADLDANGHNIGFDDATGITDDAGNELVRFQKTASAVNQIDITNAAASGSPRIDASGDDTNITLILAGKGTGGVAANFAQGFGVGLLDSDSSHALKVKTSSDLTAERTLDIKPGDADRSITLSGNLTVSGTATVPAGTALVAANNLDDVGDAATAFGNIKQAASTSASGAIEIADQSEMEAASDTSRAVVPGRQHFHPGHPKAVAKISAAGAVVGTAFNVASASRDSTGSYTVNFANAMADANYMVQITAGYSAESSDSTFGLWSNLSTTAFAVQIRNASATAVNADFGIAVYGDQ